MPCAAQRGQHAATNRTRAPARSRGTPAPQKRAPTSGRTLKPLQQLEQIGVTGQCDALEPLRPQQRHVNGGRGDRQALVGADVGGRLGAPDVLLARLQRQGEAGLAVAVQRAADDAPRHLPHVRLLAGHEAEVGSTACSTARPAAVLRPLRCPRPGCPTAPGGASSASATGLTTPITSAPCACAQSVSSCTRSRQPKKFGCGMTSAANASPPKRGQRLRQRHALFGAIGQLDQLDLLVRYDGARDLAIGRMHRGGNQHPARGLVQPHRHQDGLGQRRGAVVEAGVGCIQSGQRRDHGLVLVQQSAACPGSPRPGRAYRPSRTRRGWRSARPPPGCDARRPRRR